MDKEQKINQLALQRYDTIIGMYWITCIALMVLPALFAKDGLSIGWIIGSLVMLVIITSTQHRKASLINKLRTKIRKELN